jgi:hypothetical protein
MNPRAYLGWQMGWGMKEQAEGDLIIFRGGNNVVRLV